MPAMLLTTENDAIPFASIGYRGTTPTGTVYKIFSRQPLLDPEVLDHVFTNRSWTKRIVWKAYPVLDPRSEAPPFALDSGLCYVNALETYASAIEVGLLAARNCVHQIVTDLMKAHPGS